MVTKIINASKLDMLEILNYIEKLHQYNWKLLWIEAVAKDSNYQMLDFENRVNNSNEGYPITISELRNLNNICHQFIEILLIGDLSTKKLRRYSVDKEMRQNCSFVIELVDSTFWEVSTKDKDFVFFLSQKPAYSINQK